MLSTNILFSVKTFTNSLFLSFDIFRSNKYVKNFCKCIYIYQISDKYINCSISVIFLVKSFLELIIFIYFKLFHHKYHHLLYYFLNIQIFINYNLNLNVCLKF